MTKNGTVRGTRASGHQRRPAENRRNGRKERRKSRSLTILIIEIVVLLALLAAAYTIFVRMNVTQVGKVTLNEQGIRSNMNQGVAENKKMKGYRNIALFGVDSRKGELNRATRSDAIIIASIDQETGGVRLCSVYRDTYLNKGNDSYSKCNGAYAEGGPEQAINMLNMNLDLDITDFVTIGFGGLTDVINELGGITIEVTDAEIEHLNNYQSTMAQELGMSYTPVTKAGTQLLDGLQATAYCRIRYTSGDDFRRAERQRTVLMAIMDVAKTASVSQLESIASKVFGETYTSLDLSDIVEILKNISGYYIAGNDGFPQRDLLKTGTIGKKGSCVVPTDLAVNVEWLHEFLFDDDAYEVTQDVRRYSEEIDRQTSPYLN